MPARFGTRTGRLLLLLAACVSLGVSIGSAIAARAAKTGRLVIKDPERFFGKLPQGAKVDGSFVLTNDSSDVLEIIDIQKGCDCTEAKASKSTLAPGSSAALNAIWSTGARRGLSSTFIGVVYNYIRDGTKTAPARAAIRLIADIVPDFAFEPDPLSFKSGASETKTLRLLPVHFADVRLKDASCVHQAFKISSDPNTNTITIQFDHRSWSDEIRYAELVVVTNSPNEAQCRIPINVGVGAD